MSHSHRTRTRQHLLLECKVVGIYFIARIPSLRLVALLTTASTTFGMGRPCCCMDAAVIGAFVRFAWQYSSLLESP